MPRRFTSASPVIAGIGFGVAAGVALGAFGIGPVLSGGASDGGSDAGVREEYRTMLQESKINEAQLNSGESILADLAPTTVDGTLAERPVLVITTADADRGDVDAIQSLLKSSDMANAGTITLEEGFFDQSNADTIESLLANTLPAGAKLSTTDRSLGMHAGEALGAALYRDPKTTEPLAETSARAELLQALRDKGFISYKDETILPAQAIVVIDGAVDGENGTAFRAENTATFMEGLHEVGKYAVLSGRVESAADKGPIGVLRAENSEVSTVDSNNRWWARIATVLAVREQLDGGHGAYGSAASAEAAAPALPQPE